MKLTIEEIAKVAHEANRAYCESMGDLSQQPWEEAPEIIKNSAITGVEKHLENPMTPEESHKSWMAYKAAEGWVYGKEKDIEKKTHPCMVPYEELPSSQKVKDYIFKAICDTLKEI